MTSPDRSPGPFDATPAFTSRTLTFLFTDIEGSTARWEERGQAMAAALARHDELLRAAIEERGGMVFKTVGDAFHAAFEDADAALAAAVDAQRALAAQDWGAFGEGFGDLRVRMGIHLGKAEARDGDYFGPALNRTARLMAAGHGGQVLVSMSTQQVVRDFLDDGLELRDLGEHRLRDLRHSEHIFQVLAPGMIDERRDPATAGAVEARDRVRVAEPGAERGPGPAAARPLPETVASLLEAIRGEAGHVTLSAEQAREIAARRPADLTEHRLGRVAEWSQPRYRLDGRFVALTLLVDQGEDASGDRWQASGGQHDDLGGLLEELTDPALVVLGPPGGGKSTLLRRLELDIAIANLRGEDAQGRVTFFVALSQHRPAAPGQPPPPPGEWLAAQWSARYPDLPTLDALLAEGRMVLLLDALNEMPAVGEREHRQRIGAWKEWLVDLARDRPGNRVVFSCRSLDYAAPLSTPTLRVPQAQIEPLSDAQVREFLRAYSPVRGEGIWAALVGTAQLEALRSPYFLALLVDQVDETGELAGDRAGLFTGFVRQALRREVERDNPLFVDAGAGHAVPLLADRDLRRVAQWRWKDAYELPERGSLFPKLASLAYGMQDGAEGDAANQLRVDLDAALALLDDEQDEAIIKAGLAIAVLDEDVAADEVLYRHQLLQEYFAARVVSREPRPERVAAPWRASEVRPALAELMATLPPGEVLPPLPQTGWEETTLLAVAMAADPGAYVEALMGPNLALAGRAAAQPGLSTRLDGALLDRLRAALVARGRDAEADLRHRVACAEAAGELGDPRWQRVTGPHGEYLRPPLVAMPGGSYPIGDDAPIAWRQMGHVDETREHIPRHRVEVGPLRMGRFPVTNAEYACFVAAGGYEDERWWDTQDARRWRRGDLPDEGAMVNSRNWRRRFLAEEGLFEQLERDGVFDQHEAVERWKHWLAMDDAAFEAVIAERWAGRRMTAPEGWADRRRSGPSQPVVGVCWYEARAFGSWLAAQAGEPFRLPTEVEWEACARGVEGRAHAYGDAYDAARANTFQSHWKRAVPVGVLVEGDTPEGVSDLTGNVQEWTVSHFGGSESGPHAPRFPYPYTPDDGREDDGAPPSTSRVVRGGSWFLTHEYARAAFRNWHYPGFRGYDLGFRVLVAGDPP